MTSTFTGPYDAIVLAGGRSSRTGDVDKVEVMVDGRTLIVRACDAVVGAERLVVVGPERAGVPRRAVTTREDPPFSGPAAAIGAGLAALSADGAGVLVVVAADVPRVAEVVPMLLAGLHSHPGAEGVVARSSDGHRQPLLAAYRTEPLRRVLAAAAPLTDLSVNRVVRVMTLVDLDLTDDVIADVDTPADLYRLTEETDRG